jgi:hypothetical protein
MNGSNVNRFCKNVIVVLLLFIFMSSCFVKSKFDNPTDGVGGLLFEGLSLISAVSEGNITVSGILKDSSGNIVPSGILDISRSGSASVIQRAPSDTKVYSDANGKFSMNIYQGSFTIKVSRSDGTLVGSFSLKVSSATATPEVLSSSGLQVSGLSAAPVGTSGGAAPTISISNTPSRIEEGNSASIGIKLAGNITKSYTLSITSNIPSALSVSPSTLTFTSSNFSIDQSVTLSALEDADSLSQEVKVIFDGADIQQNIVSIVINDNIYSIPLIKTNISSCYGATGTVPCGNNLFPGQDGDYQLGTSLNYTVSILNNLFPLDYTVKDNITKLTWTLCTDGLSGSTCGSGFSKLYNWSGAKIACENLNSVNSNKGFAGITKWRLPKIYELRSLIDYSNINMIKTSTFPANESGYYWSSTDDPLDSSASAMYLDFNIGTIGNLYKPFEIGYIRCTSGP